MPDRRAPETGLPRRGNGFSRALGRTALRLFGWRIVGRLPNVPKCVAIAAPHTSNWDFLLGVSAMFALGVRVDWIGKDTLFRGPSGPLMRFLGGMPIARMESEGVVAQIVEAMNGRDRYILGLAPEGTRKRVERWKTGFYHVAAQAGVPILLVYFDYEDRTVGLGPTFEATGDIERDMAEIQHFYRGKAGKHPAQF
jgi:1-acyl-sn-glycerol-3-phosphate acyltransferase